MRVNTQKLSLIDNYRNTHLVLLPNMDYSAYNVEDFINDSYFRKWVENPDQHCHAFWQEFMKQHPEKISLLEDAREILLFLSFDVIQPSSEDQQETKAHILRQIRNQGSTGQQRLAKSPLLHSATQSRYLKAAAAITFVLTTITLLVFLPGFSREITIRTRYAQTRTVNLPDGSVIILNANSTLRFSDNWAETHKREVWLTGEAFFDVRKMPEWADAAFIVHTEGLHVEVLGTTFNVNNRRGKVKVVLNTGKVKLKPVNNVADTLTMQPRDLVEFTAASKAFVKKQVNPEEHSAWRNHTLVFNETTLMEIAGVLEDNYGLKVFFKEPELQRRKFTGAIPNQKIDLFLTILAQSMDIEMTKDKDAVYIKTQ